MIIKVECVCKTRYKFEVEPVDGKMPAPVHCPSCGADGTDYANWVIQQELAKEKETPKAPKIELPKPFIAEVPKPFTSKPAGLPPVSVPGGAPPPKAGVVPRQIRETAMAEHCFKHANQPVSGFCFFCKKPICLICMKKWGYFCSTACRHQAEERRMDIPIYEGQESVIREKMQKKARLITMGVVSLLIGLGLLWGWYSFFGSKPSVKFSVKIRSAPSNVYCKFIGPDQVLYMDDEKLTLYDAAKGKESWSKNLASYRTALNPPPEAPAMENRPGENAADQTSAGGGLNAGQLRKDFDFFEEAQFTDSQVCATDDEIWVSFFNSVVGFDRKTGSEKKKVPIEGRILQVKPAETAIFVVSVKPPRQKLLMRIELPSGQA